MFTALLCALFHTLLAIRTLNSQENSSDIEKKWMSNKIVYGWSEYDFHSQKLLNHVLQWWLDAKKLYNSASTSWRKRKLQLDKREKTNANTKSKKSKAIDGQTSRSFILKCSLTSTYVDANGNSQDSKDTEINNSMDQNRDPTGVHVSELHYPRSCRQLKQQPWRQQYKQRHWHHHWSPIYHHLFSLPLPLFSLSLSSNYSFSA